MRAIEMTSFDTTDLAPPAGFIAVVEALEDAGYEAWAVGGALRDAVNRRLAGRAAIPTPDWDVATNAHPHEVMSLFPRTVPLGIEHGTVGVVRDGIVYETTTFRQDIETDGRHAVVRFASSIEDDLARRDFTINAMAWRPSTGEFRDPFDGHGDLVNGTLRAVGEPAERFAEDYLRVLRGLRFAGRFDLEMEDETRVALIEAATRLGGLSAERVREELMKVLGDPVPSSALDLYAEAGALQTWFPELLAPAADRSSWRAHLGSVDRVSRHRPLVRLARLCVAVHADPAERRSTVDALLGRLRFSNADRDRVGRLVERYTPFVSPLDSSAQIRSWLADVRSDWRDLFRLHIAGVRTHGDARAGRVIAAAWRAVHEQVLAGPPLELRDLAVDGSDLVRLGLDPGPIMGLMLEELLAQVLEDPERNERQVLLDEAARLIEIGALGRTPAPGSDAGSRPAPPSDDAPDVR